jgi:alkanesulfonate monooxygenase SsuD/methylene tetrahydromethanopterin reductase-like flavin-dependent oxidoreductase (luciferase family)
VVFSGEHLSLPELLSFAQQAEEAGAESLWSFEVYRDAFVPLTAMAAVTKKARIGSAVAHIARPPALTALSAQSLAEYTNGRFVLGLGPVPKVIYESWYGAALRKPVTHMREYVACIRTLWTATPTAPVSYDGEFYQVRDYRRMLSVPVPPIPLYLAGTLPQMIQLAGAHADGLIANTITTPRYFTEVVHSNIQKGLATAGRSRESFELCAFKVCAVNTDVQAARRLARHAIVFSSSLPYFDIVLDPMGFTAAKLQIRDAMGRQDLSTALNAVTEDMVDALVLAGTVDDVHRQVAAFDGLFDTLILLSPFFGVEPEEAKANHRAMIEAFSA